MPSTKKKEKNLLTRIAFPENTVLSPFVIWLYKIPFPPPDSYSQHDLPTFRQEGWRGSLDMMASLAGQFELWEPSFISCSPSCPPPTAALYLHCKDRANATVRGGSPSQPRETPMTASSGRGQTAGWVQSFCCLGSEVSDESFDAESSGLIIWPIIWSGTFKDLSHYELSFELWKVHMTSASLLF